MARSSIARTLVDQSCVIVTVRGFRDVERHDGAPARCGFEHVLYLGALIADVRTGVSQNISHIIAPQPVLVIAELVADEDGPDPVLERQAIGELPLNERFR